MDISRPCRTDELFWRDDRPQGCQPAGLDRRLGFNIHCRLVRGVVPGRASRENRSRRRFPGPGRVGALRLYRSDHFAEAIAQLTEADRQLQEADPTSSSCPAYVWYFLPWPITG